MARARWLLALDRFTLDDLMETLVEAAPQGTLSRQAFQQCMFNLIQLGGNLKSQSDVDAAMLLADRIFTAFDGDNSGEVDYAASQAVFPCFRRRAWKTRSAPHSCCTTSTAMAR